MINLKNKFVVVFGLGVSGISALRLLKTLGANVFAINGGEKASWAKSPGALEFCNFSNCYSENDEGNQAILASSDLLILSPGIPRDHKILKPIHDKQIPIWGEIELGYQVIKSLNALVPIIGITGTNGKTTTTTFLGEVIKDQGLSPFIGGNIGIPFCDMAYEVLVDKKKYDYIVLELSSFQLESIVDFRPNIAMILNVFQNHGERYSDISDYAFAKFNITKNMQSDDVIILPSDYEIIHSWSKTLKMKVIEFDSRNVMVNFNLENYKLPGLHNIVNLKFVTLVGEILKFDSLKMQSSIDHFHGVHYRIEYISTKFNFKAYNDAKSTNWDATLTAIYAMENIPGDLYLIIGGKKRGHGDSILPYINEMKKNVKRFYVIGEMGVEIYSEIKNTVEVVKFEKLDEVINHVVAEKFSGVLLFSPAFPSFDQYTNYVARGEHFTSLVSKAKS